MAPQAKLRSTSSGSTESNHTLVPEAISDCKGESMIEPPWIGCDARGEPLNIRFAASSVPWQRDVDVQRVQASVGGVSPTLAWTGTI